MAEIAPQWVLGVGAGISYNYFEIEANNIDRDADDWVFGGQFFAEINYKMNDAWFLGLGYMGRLGPFNWRMPMVANIILRNLGLTLFLAGVGLSSGAPFVKNIGGAGLNMMFANIVVLLTVVLIVLLVGYYVLRINFDDVLGIACGATGNPAILACANQIAPTGKPDIGYTMIFPGVGTILKIVAVQVMLAMPGGSIT
jgi:putative transport protein